MKTLPEIFKDNPQLLETEEVKELVVQFQKQFSAIKEAKHQFWMKVTELTLHSECYVIDGLKCKDVIEKINDLAFEN